MQNRIKTIKKNESKSGETLNYKEVRSVYSDSECNALIVAGWKILHVGLAHVDSQGFNCKNIFIMGKE